jgi:hypothetical protein
MSSSVAIIAGLLVGGIMLSSGAQAQYYDPYGRDYGPPRARRTSGLVCAVNPEYRQYRRSCLAADTFYPGDYCECRDGRQLWPGVVRPQRRGD